MELLRALRRTVLAIVAAALVAGCMTPSESTGPTDLDRDKDNNGLPDDAERNMTNRTEPEPSDPSEGAPSGPSPLPGLPSDPYAG